VSARAATEPPPAVAAADAPAAAPAPDLVARFLRLRGWRRRLAAFAAGATAALAMAPFYLLPALVVGFGALLLLTDGARRAPRPFRAGFAAGWFFGFGYFLVGLYWVAYSFLVQAEQFAWMAPFAVVGLPAFVALFTGVAAGVAARHGGTTWRRVLLLTGLLAAADYARGHWFTGLPWNLPGQALAGTAIGAQSVAWWGAYGLSLVVLVIAMSPAAWLAEGRRGLWRGAAVALALIALLYGAGAMRLSLHPPSDHPDVFVRIVQPNIPQREKIDEALWARNYRRHVALSAGPAPRRGRLYILWPENAVPVIDEVESGLDLLSRTLADNAVLVTGAVRRANDADGRARYFNSVAVIAETPQGRRPVAYYDKHHLVPFGEYLPLEGLLRAVGLAQLAPYDDGFAQGPGPATLEFGGPAFAALICYEAIFPGAIYPKGRRPDWIATVTNDSWFGDSAGPRQHFDQARLRAVETGLPLARSANSGISGLIDGAGRVRARLPLYEAGVIDSPLPRPLAPTLYDRLGDLVFFALAAAALAAGISTQRKGD
jgi:apolipoprotein N-acyltransferase